ncbi:hypothetical protein ATCC90586_001381 [Pythium insidiosum]|nr:hypothetical protein ATCC90586_001381 [Pythium insidiosum]
MLRRKRPRLERSTIDTDDLDEIALHVDDTVSAMELVLQRNTPHKEAPEDDPNALVSFRDALVRLSQQAPLTLSHITHLLAGADGGDERQVHAQNHVALLQRIGFLRPTTELEDVVYELSMPGLGKLITAVTKTRVDLLGVLRRTKHKETFEHQLKKLKLRHTSFDLEYHLSEMEGKGLIRRTRVTSGTLVTLVQK